MVHVMPIVLVIVGFVLLITGLIWYIIWYLRVGRKFNKYVLEQYPDLDWRERKYIVLTDPTLWACKK